MMVASSTARSLDVFGDLDASTRQRTTTLGIDVVADHPPAAIDKIPCENAAHNAETDNADSAFYLRHSESPSLGHERYLQSRWPITVEDRTAIAYRHRAWSGTRQKTGVAIN